MARTPRIRRAVAADALAVNSLLSEWFDWTPANGRLHSVRKAIRNRELLVAREGDGIVGFLHQVNHVDVIDGGPNTLITAFYVSLRYQRKGVGLRLLQTAIDGSLKRGIVGVETGILESEETTASWMLDSRVSVDDACSFLPVLPDSNLIETLD